MKRLLLAILLLFGSVSINALYSQDFKTQKRIYLLDVTLSMHGYGDSPDIWPTVIQFLSSEIKSIEDPQTEIVVMPFQESVLDIWKYKATPEGKTALLKKIADAEKTYTKVTQTNITLPFRDATKQLDKDKENVLILLTDGAQNAKGYPKETLLQEIRNWCTRTSALNAFAYYVMLTEAANDPELLSAIEEACRMRAVKPSDINTNPFVELAVVNTRLHYNFLTDPAEKEIKITCKKNLKIPSGLKVAIKSENNPYFDVNDVAEIQNGIATFSIRTLQTKEQLQRNLPRDENYMLNLHIELVNGKQIEKSTNQVINLVTSNLNLEVVNKPEKTLKIHVK